MKTYVLTISEFFPKTHNKSGLPTGFINSINAKTKKHTIRGNYELWKKRFEKIASGDACLSVRYWTGKPYNSTQVEVYNFKNSDGIGIQEILFDDHLYSCLIDGKRYSVNDKMISENDGLTSADFEEWFKKYDLTKSMAIIHFTEFRYCL